MNFATKHINKPFKFSTVSTFTIEDRHKVDRVVPDGRVNVVHSHYAQPGGLCYYALRAVRRFDHEAKLAIGALVGLEERGMVIDSLDGVPCDTSFLLGVPGKRTNRALILQSCETGENLIARVERPLSFASDLDGNGIRRLMSLTAQSNALAIGNVPVPLTRMLIDFGRRVGTYMALVPGEGQLAVLDRLEPDLLCLSFGETQRALGIADSDRQLVFDRLVRVCGARHAIVMTGGGSAPTYVHHRFDGKTWALEPHRIQGANGELLAPLNTLGAGDTLAGTITFLLGLPRRLVKSDQLLEIVRFAQAVAAAHVSGNQQAGDGLVRTYWDVRSRLIASTLSSQSRAKAA